MPQSARMALVEITDMGRDRLEVFVVQLHRVDRRIMSVLSDRQQQALLEMLAAIQANLPTGTLAQAAGGTEARTGYNRAAHDVADRRR